MKRLIIAVFALATLSGGTAAFARSAYPVKHTKVDLKKSPSRAEKARRQIAADLHLRGSNIPPAFSATGTWAR